MTQSKAILRCAGLTCFALIFVLFVTWVAMGCAGLSRNSLSNVSGFGSARVTIHWPKRVTSARSARLIPVASNSIVIDVSDDTEQLQTQTVPRPTDGSDSSTVIFHLLPPGVLDVVASAYPTTDGSGVAQATGSGTVTVTSQDVTPSVTVTMSSTIQSISIDPPNPQVQVGMSIPLTPSAVDADGNVVVVSPQTLTWQTGDSTIVSIDNNGNATGVAVGQTTVTLTESESGKTVTQTIVCTGTGGTIEGNVTDENGNPFPGVSVVTSGGTTSSTVVASTDGNGYYELDNVPPGDRVVTFYGGGAQTTDEVSLAAGEVYTLNVQLQASSSNPTGPPVITLNSPVVDDPDAQATISGTITNMDSSQAIVIVNSSEYLFTVNSDGTFSTVVNLQHGTNTVVVRATNALGTTYSPTLTITISGENTVVGQWDSILVQGDAYNEEYQTLNSDGTYIEDLPDGTEVGSGTYTFADSLLSFSAGEVFQVVWISSAEAMLYSTIDDKILHWSALSTSSLKHKINRAKVGRVTASNRPQMKGLGPKHKNKTPALRKFSRK